jgi:uncharacterized RDD family membrane protein YckC
MTTYESPSQAQRHGAYAGFFTRMVAFFIDRFIIAAILGGAIFFAGFILQTFQLSQALGLSSLTGELAVAISGASGAVLSMVYDVGCWTLAGQTPGKRIMGLLVVRTNGERLKLGPAILRWLGYWLSGILFLGFLWILLDSKRQGFHDKLARTLVIYSRPEQIGLEASTPVRDRLGNLTRKQGLTEDKPA